MNFNTGKCVLGIAVALAGCATGLPTDQTVPIQKQYTTGSNIPRDPSKTVAKTVNTEQNEISRPQVLMPAKPKNDG